MPLNLCKVFKCIYSNEVQLLEYFLFLPRTDMGNNSLKSCAGNTIKLNLTKKSIIISSKQW